MQTTSKPPDLIARIELGVFCGVALLVAACHVRVLLHAGGLWRDEIQSVNTAVMPTLGRLWDNLWLESFPVFSLLILRVWLTIFSAGGDTAIRVLGLCIGLGICGVLFLNARLAGRSLPLVSLSLFALNAVTVRYGDSVRAYGLGILLILIAFNLFWRVATAPGVRNALLATLCAVLSVHTLYQNAFVIAALCAGGVAVNWHPRRWDRIALLLGIGAVAAVSLVPYLPVMARQAGLKIMYQSTWNLASVGKALLDTLRAGGPFSFLCWLLFSAAGLAGAAYVLAAPAGRMPAPARALLVYAGITTVVGWAGYAAFLLVLKWMSQSWYFLLPLALLATWLELVSAAILSTVRARLVRLVVLVGLALAAAFPVWNASSTRHTNVDAIAAKLEACAGPEDLILITPYYCGVTFNRYYHGRTRWTSVPPFEDMGIQRTDLLKQKLMAENPAAPALDQAKQTLRVGHRVWWVGWLVFVRPGYELPSLLPAPDPRVGWSATAYFRLWDLQTAYLIQSHALNAAKVAVPLAERVDPVERMQVLVAEGWR